MFCPYLPDMPVHPADLFLGTTQHAGAFLGPYRFYCIIGRHHRSTACMHVVLLDRVSLSTQALISNPSNVFATSSQAIDCAFVLTPIPHL